MIKRDKWDVLFSQLIRERVGWKCEESGKHYPEGQRQGLHCSHFWSRRHLATRWHPWNACSLGYGAHQKFTGDPGLHSWWYRELVGQAKMERIAKLAQTPVKWTKDEKDDLYEHMKLCLQFIHQRRTDGETGRIEIAVWPGFDDLTPAVMVRNM